MKVLMVNNQLYVLGGSETYMFSVGEELKKRGNEVEYFGIKDPENKHGNRFGIYAQKSKTPFSFISNKGNIQRFASLLDLYKPDIIHMNLIYFTLTEDIIYEAKKRKIPVVQTIHDSKIVCPSHRLYIEHKRIPCKDCVQELDFANCIKNKCIDGSLPKSVLASFEANYYKKKGTYSTVDKYIFVCQFMMNLHIGNGIDEKQAMVLHNFTRIKRRVSLHKSVEKYVVYFGRIGREKGAEILSEVCKRTPNIHYKLIGTGDMECLFTDLGNCELMGFMSGEELEDIVSGAVCSVLPSIWYENCPMTVLESIALGTPVIGANIGGIPELIEHGRTGLIFESGDDIEFENCIRELYFDEEKANIMARNCISAKYLMNVDEYTDCLLSIYHSML